MLRVSLLLILLLGAASSPLAQVTTLRTSIPVVVKFSGKVQHGDGNPVSGFRSLTFGIFQDQTSQVPLWLETQNAKLDEFGRFSVLLGVVAPQGIPPEMFSSGEPRWIGVTLDDGVEISRTLLTSVPYAFKAGDADTLGGKGPDDFVSVQQLDLLLKNWTISQPSVETSATTGSLALPSSVPPSDTLVPNLNADLLHGFTDSAFAKIRMTNIFTSAQSFPGGVELPPSTIEVNSSNIFDSSPLDLSSSAPNPQTGAPATQLFRWLAQPATAAAPSRLSLLFGTNGASPASTGLSINSDGTINFAPGQQLPVGVASGSPGPPNTGSPPVSTPIVQTQQYAFQTLPQQASINVGTNLLTMRPCPVGVNGADVWHYLSISGTGTPEVVLISGGSCTSGASSGTIEFTACHAHPSGYRIGSASDGIQEAFIVASMPNGLPSRTVMIDPGNHLVLARVSIRTSSITVTSSGATLTCAMKDTCIMLGDPSNANLFASVVLSGLRVIPGIPAGTWPAVEDNANGSQVINFGPAPGAVPTASFGSLIQVDNDQAATIDNLNTNLAAWSRCDTSFCSTAIVGPGPFSTNAGIMWVRNSNLGLQCLANGIDNENGNFVSVENSVVEAYPQFGIRARTVFIGTTVTLNGVYEEVGNCTNPLGTGMAGLIVGGGSATVSASVGPVGQLPQFSNTGSNGYFYYIVVHSSTMGTSPPYLAGFAETNGVGSIPVTWNKVGTSGVITYDVLRLPGDGASDFDAPYGTGSFAIATGTPASSCSNTVCEINDNAASTPASYTVAGNTTYWPSLWLWPGDVILTTPSDYENTGGGSPTTLSIDTLNSNSGAGIVNSAGASQPSVFAQQCDPQGNWSSIWISCIQGNAYSNDNGPIVATMMQLSANNSGAGLKGRLLFELPIGGLSGATHVITLEDSNPAKTQATPGNRPTWDPNDAYIGYDQPTDSQLYQTQLTFGAPAAISLYIGNTGDNVNYGERLTANLKIFRVPVQVTQLVTGTPNNTDTAGTVVIAGGTSASYTFTGMYNTPPSCTLTPLADPSATGPYWASITTTVLTANVETSGNISFSYHCWGH